MSDAVRACRACGEPLVAGKNVPASKNGTVDARFVKCDECRSKTAEVERVRACRSCGATLKAGENAPADRFGRVDGRVRQCDTCKTSGVSVESSPITVEEMLAEQARRDQERAAAAEIRKATALENRVRRYLEQLRESLSAYEPTPLVVDPITTDELPEHEWVLVLSDWHVGQQTRIEETGGLFYQDLTVTRFQIAELWEAIAKIHEVERGSRRINKIHVLVLGDIVEGDDMRRSQHRKVTDLITVQTIQAFDLLVWIIRQLLTRFPEVTVDMVGGNHDRLSQRPGDGGLGELGYQDTMAWLMGEFLKRTLEADIRSGRLQVTNWETFFGYRTICGRRFVFEHGASFRWASGGYGGVPYYAIHNAGKRYVDMVGGADFVIFGHGHQSMALPNGRGWLFMNGSLPPSSQYLQSSYKSVLRPQQWLLSIHDTIGLTGTYPIYLDHPGILQPGEIWEREQELRSLQDRQPIAVQSRFSSEE